MKKLFILAIITTIIVGFTIKSVDTYAVTEGDLAILIEIGTDECTLYDWNNELFIVADKDTISYAGNLFKTLFYSDLIPGWDLALPGEQELIEPYLTTIFAYFKTSDNTDIYDNGYDTGYVIGKSDGYALGYAAGYSKGYLDGFASAGGEEEYDVGYDIGYAAGEEAGYTDGYADGYYVGLIEGTGLPDADAVYDVGYADGYDDGAALPNDSRFYENIENWIVPAIITVLFFGGLISIISWKRKASD